MRKAKRLGAPLLMPLRTGRYARRLTIVKRDRNHTKRVPKSDSEFWHAFVPDVVACALNKWRLKGALGMFANDNSRPVSVSPWLCGLFAVVVVGFLAWTAAYECVRYFMA